MQIVKSPEDLNVNNINLAAFDWHNHNLIITKGWELKRISYSTFQPFSRVKERLVRIVLHEQKGDLTYYYRIKKVDIFLDEHYLNGGVTFK
ncbi:hypothetical protein D3C77_617420 [compost metagenome]